MSVPPALRRDGQATREKLLRAALELYTTAGFRGTTTPEIALRAGVAEGTIYRHFTGKEELLNEVYRSSQRWALSLITEPEDDRAAGVGPRLRRLALRMLEAADRDPAATRMALHFEDGRHLDEQSRVLARQVRDALQQIVASGKADGAVRTGPAELWAGVWLAVVRWAAERVSVREWSPGHPQAIQAVEAAWDAIKA
jgi:AcrR family transcriptional regulator